MIKIEKQVTLHIDGEDVKTLKDICELALYALDDKPARNFSYRLDDVKNFAHKIWDKVGEL
jgi:hypothetical protein